MLVTVKNAVSVGPTTSFGEIYTVVDNDNDSSQRHQRHRQTARGNLLLTPGVDVVREHATRSVATSIRSESRSMTTTEFCRASHRRWSTIKAGR